MMVKGFLISDLVAVFVFFFVFFLEEAYLCPETMFCQGTALFDVMTVLACLSSQTTVTTCTYMRPHNQSFFLRSAGIIF